MKRSLFLFLAVSILASCQDETVILVPIDPLTVESEVFVSDSGEEFFMGALTSFCYGFAGSANIHENSLVDYPIPDNLPSEVDLSNFLPPVGNQGRLPSCTAWATTYYGRSLQVNIQNAARTNKKVAFSPSFIYNQMTEGNNCIPTSVQFAMEKLVSEGALGLDLFPYQAEGCDELPKEENQILAQEYRLNGFKVLTGENMISEMKALLNDQNPVVITMGLDLEFGKKDDAGLSAYRPHRVVPKDIQGAHAMLVVGYSDENNAFKVVNSWGEGWGDAGFFWADYDAFEDVLNPDKEFRVLCEAVVGF
ncbi:C1 family peptidase [Algoriphagus sediminis]|uniref:C1 family peptidase n=1 Tax=Algoriphagus sediminis TaxID=3057113 RepID=A0ABT7YH96_9BACT|nr:C1 family peptidase [Algoriphagus sediminis]MDN3205912.1 C1 family peptidase [Algoriphagus sediminis]